MSLIDSLIKNGQLKTPRIIKAFKEIKRADFMFEGMEHLAEIDEPLALDYGQTISQPSTVAFMLEQLQPRARDNVLDVGSGSGWTTALLSHIVGEKGKVTAIEIIPELKEFGEKNIAKYDFGNTKIICADGSKGYNQEAPFNRILASASGDKIPESWKEQLKVKGRIVAPVKNSIWTLIKEKEGVFKEIEHKGFMFVPLVKS